MQITSGQLVTQGGKNYSAGSTDCDTVLWFGRIAGIYPGFKAAFYRVDFGKTCLQHQERRTGARIFSRSGAVGYIPLLWVQSREISLQVGDRQADRAGRVLRRVLFSGTRVYQYRFSIPDSLIRFLNSQAGNVILRFNYRVAAESTRASINQYPQADERRKQKQYHRQRAVLSIQLLIWNPHFTSHWRNFYIFRFEKKANVHTCAAFREHAQGLGLLVQQPARIIFC